jgi:CBS-domain-containing membrane protein
MHADVDTALPIPRPIHTLPASATLDEAVTRMRELGVHHLVLRDEHGAYSVLSTADLLAAGLRDPGEGWRGHTLAMSAARPVSPAQPDSPLDAVIDRMLVAGVTCVPIVDPIGGALGVLTVSDLVQILRAALQPEPSGARAALERLAAEPWVQSAVGLLIEAGL